MYIDENSVNLKNMSDTSIFAFLYFFTVKNARPNGSGNKQSAAVS